MNRNQQYYEEEIYEGDYSERLPHDTIEEMEYHARKQKEESNVVNVAKAVLVVAMIGLICAIIDFYIEKEG